MKPASTAQQEAWISKRLADLPPDAQLAMREVLTRAVKDKRLLGDFVLHLEKHGKVTVATILDNPDKFHGARCADPLEPDYGNDRRIACVNLKAAGKPYIWSHAHGGQRFNLEPDGGDKDLSHLTVARKVVASFGAGNLINTGAFTWRWNGAGVWKQVDPREVKQRIHEVAPGGKIKKSFVDSVHDLVQTEVYRAGHRFDQDRRAINLANGELKWTGSAWQLQPHCRESYRTTMIPVCYDPKAKAPRFERFLNEIFRDDEDQVQKFCLVCEMLGYCLMASCEYEKFFILIGPGANGKSVLMHILSKLVGPEHVSAVQPNQFENRFQRAHLHGKLVNLVTEIAEGHEIADAQLKSITSGELTTAEHKHRPPFDFHPFSTCVFGTNHMPHTRDFSDALFRRASIISFNRTFDEEEQDKRLKEKLEGELPGILNLSLEALKGVLTRGVFAMPQSTQELKAEWRVECDQVAQFVQDKCDVGPMFKELSGALFKAYQEWAANMGVRRPVSHKNFISRLRRLGLEPDKGGAGVRLVYGVTLR